MRARSSRLAFALGLAFVVALLMGPGPGVLLLQPSGPDEPPPTILGVPGIYAWALLWAAVMGGVVIVAARTVWRSEPAD